jgi:hypothetical protein
MLPNTILRNATPAPAVKSTNIVCDLCGMRGPGGVRYTLRVARLALTTSVASFIASGVTIALRIVNIGARFGPLIPGSNDLCTEWCVFFSLLTPDRGMIVLGWGREAIPSPASRAK